MMKYLINLYRGSSYGPLFIITTLLFSFTGCKKGIEVDPPINQIIGKEVYNSNANAAAVLTGIYSDMSGGGTFTGINSISLYAGLSSDELTSTTSPSDILSILYTNNLTNQGSGLFWSNLYAFIFRTNSAIEGITASSGVTSPVRKQLLGEAKFLRALMYFYLVNLYGDVPLIISTDIKKNIIAPRTEKNIVYQQITKDLKEAQLELSESYLLADVSTQTTERVRPNQAVATALLARVYIYTGEWALAELAASQLISNSSSYRLESLADAFSQKSKEAIWQLRTTGLRTNNTDAEVFVLGTGPTSPIGGANGGSRPVYLSKELFNSFGSGDSRKRQWIDSIKIGNVTYPYVYKYKAWIPGTSVGQIEYLMVFRLAEQFLIRAEARAMLGRLNGANSAASDLDVVRQRAGLGTIGTIKQPEALDVILNERKLEFFTEWGHRWLDLKRTGKVDEVMSEAVKTKVGIANWAPYKALYPIPVNDIKNNINLRGHQNPGYPEF